MSAIGSKLRRAEGDRVLFWCPGCDEAHTISDAPGRWTFNGDGDRPTFSPSVLVTSGHYARDRNAAGDCWCTFNAANPKKPGERVFTCDRCHSFVRDGRIEFLGDSTHALAGQTVDLPNWPTDAA